MIKLEELTQVTTKDLEEINSLIPQLSSSAKPLTNARFLEMLKDIRMPILVLRDGQKIVGIAMIVIYNVLTEKRAWIEEVTIDEKYRGKGLGEQLSKALIEIAKKERVQTVYLSSRPSREAANKLYQKLGFEQKETNVYRLKL